ncbi:MAG: hypothetical protein C5B54_05250 [Acidobacteria bacterium]|nr:MAG: hypothetical protein C5B54_05250 [Acidobacteriota bacterium]
MRVKTSPSLALICCFFFGSGFAALLYQIVWLKYLSLLFGNTTFATAALLAAYFSGLSLGSWLLPRFPKLLHAPLRKYGLMEIGVGCFATLFPLLYSGFKYPFASLFNLIGPQGSVYNVLIFFVAFSVLIIPTSLMGATLPLLSHYLIQDDSIAEKTGLLYGVNTVGAVFGILLTAFVLIPDVGLHATIYIGVIVNLVFGVICFFYGSRSNDEVQFYAEPAVHSSILTLYAVSGLIAIGYEVIWTRILVLHLGSSVYAYAIMLAVFLLGISSGSYFSGKWIASKASNRNAQFAWIQAIWAVSILLLVLQFAYFSNVLGFLATRFHGLTWYKQLLVFFLATLQALFLPTFLSGSLFPVVVSALSKSGASVRYAVSLSYSYNTVGGIFGSLISGLLLIPILGTQNAMLFFGAVSLTLAWFSANPSGNQKKVILVLFLLYGVFWYASQGRINLLKRAGIFQMPQGEELIHLEEDISATISVEKRKMLNFSFYSLSVNGVNVAGTSPSLVAIQKMQAHIPMILYGPRRPKNVLHIGFGSGGTAYALTLHPHTHVTVVELSRGVVRTADKYMRAVNHGIVQSNKINIIYFDGRSFLQNTSQNFDVILSDSIHPRYSGNGSLYTEDYYRLVYNRLTPGGVHSQWIPLYSLSTKNLKEILKAFNDVFSTMHVWYINSSVNPYIVVTGKKSSEPAISLENVRDAFQIPEVRDDLKKIGVFGEYSLLDNFLFGEQEAQKYLRSTLPHTDDSMTAEYESSRVLDYQGSWLSNFQSLLEHRESIQNYMMPSTNWDLNEYQRFYNASDFNLAGQVAFLQNSKQKALQFFERARQMNPEDSDPFEYSTLKN